MNEYVIIYDNFSFYIKKKNYNSTFSYKLSIFQLFMIVDFFLK